MQCRELMKSNVACVRFGQTVRDAAKIMRDGNLGFVPVCDIDGRVLGTLTDRDLAIRVLADGLSFESSATSVMTPMVVACLPDDDVQIAAERMAQAHVSRIVVVDTANRLEGVISLSDLAAALDPARAANTLKAIASREARASVS